MVLMKGILCKILSAKEKRERVTNHRASTPSSTVSTTSSTKTSALLMYRIIRSEEKNPSDVRRHFMTVAETKSTNGCVKRSIKKLRSATVTTTGSRMTSPAMRLFLRDWNISFSLA